MAERWGVRLDPFEVYERDISSDLLETGYAQIHSASLSGGSGVWVPTSSAAEIPGTYLPIGITERQSNPNLEGWARTESAEGDSACQGPRRFRGSLMHSTDPFQARLAKGLVRQHLDPMSDGDQIPALNMALADRYRIGERIGAGGMATVYLADDLRHERRVALKVLKPELAAIVGSERFLAEIKTTANLQHPNILPLFDSGEAGGYLYYVMPYVQGESLRARLDRETQLPVDEAVRLAASVAEALDYAHRQGVVHRDIKPANVLLPDGKPVIADFGIALAMRAGSGDRLTETGLSLGTPYYMSPEQATGDQTVGHATDVWALGCVLYEMLVGEPPFTGSTPQAVLGRIIGGTQVSASEARGTVPTHVDAAIRRAIERVPADRFGRAADFAQALADPGFRHGPEGSVPTRAVEPRRRLEMVVGLVAAFAAGLLVPTVLQQEEQAPVIRYELVFVEGEAPRLGLGASFAFPQDGSMLAYVGPNSGGPGTQIWVREQDRETGMPIAGTEGGISPFFSPDGLQVGYIHSDLTDLQIVSVDGGPPVTVVRSDVERYGAGWGEDGYIYFIGDAMGLYRVPASGDGAVEEVASVRPDERIVGYAWPDVLPDDRGVLVTLMRGLTAGSDDDIGVIDPETGRLEVLVSGKLGRYLPTGHLVYVSRDGDLVAAPFDPDDLRITGPSMPLESGLQRLVYGPDMAVSRSGRLLYTSAPEPLLQELVWVDRSGEAVPVDPGWTFVPDPIGQQPALSPGDRHIALALVPERGPQQIWVKEVDGPGSRLPFDHHAGRPTWSPGGEEIVFLSDTPSLYDVWSIPANGAGEAEILADLDHGIGNVRWAPDGTLLLRTPRPIGQGDILAFNPETDTTARPLVATELTEAAPILSPDGRFLAYLSQESGLRPGIYVRPYPDVNSARHTVSPTGGAEPVWSHDGQELFYKVGAADSVMLVAARVETESEFRILSRDTLFTIPPGQSSFWDQTYDVTEDGQRFLFFRYVDGERPTGPGTSRFHVVENFDQELLRRMGN